MGRCLQTSLVTDTANFEFHYTSENLNRLIGQIVSIVDRYLKKLHCSIVVSSLINYRSITLLYSNHYFCVCIIASQHIVNKLQLLIFLKHLYLFNFPRIRIVPTLNILHRLPGVILLKKKRSTQIYQNLISDLGVCKISFCMF